MEKLQDFQMFTNKEKIGMLPPDTWIIFSSYDYKDDTMYRIALDGQEIFRPIAIIEGSLLYSAIESGNITLLGFKKLKKEKDKKKK
ncbi:MAG: hypothetical protein ACRC1T_09345 [Clostridium chrysemydis]|uniref:hypothetical protein n=1 Tax=Clostridium chrysemydis TaxID=2665504 RepID=UPI003F3797AF